jgi:hypothetical protein
MSNIWKQPPVDIFRYTPPRVTTQTATTPSAAAEPAAPEPSVTSIPLGDTSSLHSLTDSEGKPIFLPDRIVLPLEVDPTGQAVTPVAVGSCESMSTLNMILSIVLVILISVLIMIGIKKYAEYHAAQRENDEENKTDEEIVDSEDGF